jgi:hypothetical protein
MASWQCSDTEVVPAAHATFLGHTQHVSSLLLRAAHEPAASAASAARAASWASRRLGSRETVSWLVSSFAFRVGLCGSREGRIGRRQQWQARPAQRRAGLRGSGAERDGRIDCARQLRPRRAHCALHGCADHAPRKPSAASTAAAGQAPRPRPMRPLRLRRPRSALSPTAPSTAATGQAPRYRPPRPPPLPQAKLSCLVPSAVGRGGRRHVFSVKAK